jgi:hypothetical protein
VRYSVFGVNRITGATHCEYVSKVPAYSTDGDISRNTLLLMVHHNLLRHNLSTLSLPPNKTVHTGAVPT